MLKQYGGHPLFWCRLNNKFDQRSEPEKSTVSTEKEAARSEIKKTLAEKRDALRQQMMADGKDSKEAAFDAEVQTALEQAAETADILKKYGKVGETFSITGGVINVDVDAGSEGLAFTFHPSYKNPSYGVVQVKKGVVNLQGDNNQLTDTPARVNEYE